MKSAKQVSDELHAKFEVKGGNVLTMKNEQVYEIAERDRFRSEFRDDLSKRLHDDHGLLITNGDRFTVICLHGNFAQLKAA